MSQADFEKWQARYAQAGPPEPADPFLVELGSMLPSRGRALDVAGGAGRHALFLAGRGLRVTLVDISPAGLDLAWCRAADAGVSIATAALDLERDPLPDGPYELVLCTSFLPSQALWRQMVDRLSPGGKLVYVQPTTTNLERHAHPSRRFLLEPGQLQEIVSALDLHPLRLEEGWDPTGRHTARLLAEKPRPATLPAGAA